MARSTILLAALTLALPLVATAATPMVDRPFLAELARQCPAQHLENLSAGGLELIMEGFEARFTPAQTRELQDTIGERCAKIEAGLSCGNGATLDLFRRRHMLKAFVREACASGVTCRSYADCTPTKPQP